MKPLAEYLGFVRVHTSGERALDELSGSTVLLSP
jgi:hypothetical protein